MKNALYIAGGIALVGAVAVAGYFWSSRGSGAPAPGNLQRAAQTPPPPNPAPAPPASAGFAADVGNYSRAVQDVGSVAASIWSSFRSAGAEVPAIDDSQAV